MIDQNSLENVNQLLRMIEKRQGGSIILKYLRGGEVESLSARGFFRMVDCCAGRLDQLGLAAKHIGLMGANRWQWMVYLCAVFRIGSTAVLLSPDLNREEVSQRAVQTDLTAVICDEELLHTVNGEKLTVVNMDEIPRAELPFRESCAGPEDLACILFTSGTTAQSKAVMFSHRALIAGICHDVIRFSFESQLAILPMHHIAGFASVLNTWYLGRVVCMGQQMKYLYRYLEKMQPDYVLTVPSVLQVILKKLKYGGSNGSELGWYLRMVGCGGARFPSDVIRFLNERNIRVLQSYGATEAGGIGFGWEMTPGCANSIGKPCPELETKIVEGELYLRSKSLMNGYYGDPEATREVLVDGWYATGDLCEQDADGFLYLRGRKKNLIILSNGENVSPEQIESALMNLGLSGEVMVGLESELITAFVYPENGWDEGRIEDLIRQYNASVPSYRQIMNLRIMDAPLAKTDLGKKIRYGVTGGN